MVREPRSQQDTNQQIMIVVEPQVMNDRLQPTALKKLKIMSSIQIVIGLLSIGIGIALILFEGRPYLAYGYSGYGIWNGVFFVLVGGIELGAVKHNSRGWITGNMVLNIICSAIWCVVLTFMASLGLVYVSELLNGCSDYDHSYHRSDTAIYRYFCQNKKYNTYYALDSLLVIMGVLQFIITIWCAALCCGAVCRCCKSSSTTSTSPNNNILGHYRVTGRQRSTAQSMPMNVYTAYPVAQPGFNIQQGFGVHQPIIGGQVVMLQGTPDHTLSPSASGYVTHLPSDHVTKCATPSQTPPAYAK